MPRCLLVPPVLHPRRSRPALSPPTPAETRAQREDLPAACLLLGSRSLYSLLSTLHQQRLEPSERICFVWNVGRQHILLRPHDRSPESNRLLTHLSHAAFGSSLLAETRAQREDLPADPLASLESLLVWNVGQKNASFSGLAIGHRSPAGRSRTCHMPRSVLLFLQRLEHSERICSERICTSDQGDEGGNAASTQGWPGGWFRSAPSLGG